MSSGESTSWLLEVLEKSQFVRSDWTRSMYSPNSHGSTLDACLRAAARMRTEVQETGTYRARNLVTKQVVML